MNCILRATSLSFRYPQNQAGFGPFSLSIQAGESILISGRSGSGKSTLARCLTGIIPHLYHGDFRGEVVLKGMRTDQTPLWELSETAGFVFQNPALQILAPTVEEEIVFGLENLGLSPGEVRNRAEEALFTFGLERFRQRAPHTLSGGEQQKLALAAVMARRPELLVLDEPLSMLDSTSAVQLVAHLSKQLAAGLSMILFEHREAYLRAIPDLRVESLAAPDPAEIDEPAWAQTAPRPRQTLVVEQLQVKRGKNRILKGLSLTLLSHQIVALVGPNGVGKTTFLRTLAGFQDYQGTICLAEQPGKPQFGMVFQNPDVQLFNASVGEETSLPDSTAGHELVPLAAFHARPGAVRADPTPFVERGRKTSGCPGNGADAPSS